MRYKSRSSSCPTQIYNMWCPPSPSSCSCSLDKFFFASYVVSFHRLLLLFFSPLLHLVCSFLLKLLNISDWESETNGFKGRPLSYSSTPRSFLRVRSRFFCFFLVPLVPFTVSPFCSITTDAVGRRLEAFFFLRSFFVVYILWWFSFLFCFIHHGGVH